MAVAGLDGETRPEREVPGGDPNIIRLHELFEHDGAWFFTMELVDGIDFLHWVPPAPERFASSRRRGE